MARTRGPGQLGGSETNIFKDVEDLVKANVAPIVHPDVRSMPLLRDSTALAEGI